MSIALIWKPGDRTLLPSGRTGRVVLVGRTDLVVDVGGKLVAIEKKDADLPPLPPMSAP